MNQQSSRRRRRMTVISTVTALGAALALGGGTLARLSATQTSDDQVLNSGTASLAIEGPGGTVEFEEVIRNVSAGDRVVQYADVVNTGTLGLDNFSVSQTSSGALVTDVLGLDSVFQSCTVAWNPATDTCAGTVSDLVSTDISRWGAQKLPLTGMALAADATAHLRVVTTLDSGAPNTSQGQSATINYTVEATQGNSANDSTPAVKALSTWSGTNIADLPMARYEHATAVVDGVVYVMGGRYPTQSYRSTNSVISYDQSTGTWVERASLPVETGAITSTVVNGIIYVIDGYPGKTYAYDPKSDTWTIKAALPSGMSALRSVATIGSTVYVVGTALSDGFPSGTIYAYDTQSDTWSAKERNPLLRSGHSLTAVDGLLYAAGGNSNNTFVSAYDPKTNVWTSRAPLPQGRVNSLSMGVGGLLYVIGGSDSSYQASNTIQVYNPKTDLWTTTTSSPVGFGETQAVELDGGVLITSGFLTGPTVKNWTLR